MEIVQKRPQRRRIAAVLFNQFDQLPLKSVAIVVDLGQLR
jgi:hypothetical protein